MRSLPILLDTCAALWSSEPAGLSEDARSAIAQAEKDNVPVLVSPITAWEVGLLVSRGRVALRTEPRRWFDELIEAGVELADLDSGILVDSSFLPGDIHSDPADRILAATARAFGYRLMTRDRPLLDYAAAGHLQAIAC